MTTIGTLTHRNLLLYFRDRMGVFLSLLGAVILLLLYAVFLGALQIDNVQSRMPDASSADVHRFVNSWVYSGIVMITTMTTGLAALNVFVEDRASGRFKEFLVSPVRRSQLVIAYLLSSWVVAVLMSTVILLLGAGVLRLLSGDGPGFPQLLQAFGYVCLLSLGFAAFSSFLVTFITSTGAFSSLSTIVGTLLGFLAGAYIPLGTVSTNVSDVINAMPFSQAAMLMRQPLVTDSLETLSGDQDQARTALREFYGLDLYISGAQISPLVAAGVMVAIALAFTAWGVLRIDRRIR